LEFAEFRQNLLRNSHFQNRHVLGEYWHSRRSRLQRCNLEKAANKTPKVCGELGDFVLEHRNDAVGFVPFSSSAVILPYASVSSASLNLIEAIYIHTVPGKASLIMLRRMK
jgi:hypothetical protein